VQWELNLLKGQVLNGQNIPVTQG